MTYSRGLKVISFSQSEMSGRDLRGRFNFEDKLTVSGHRLNHEDIDLVEKYIKEEWKGVMQEFITLSIINEVYQTVSELIKNDYNVEVKMDEIDDEPLKEKFRVIYDNVNELKGMYKRKIVSNKGFRENKMMEYKSLVILEKAGNNILDYIKKDNGYFHIVSGLSFTNGNIDIITSMDRVALASITSQPNTIKLNDSNVDNQGLYHKVVGESLNQKIQGNSNNLVKGYNQEVEKLNKIVGEFALRGDIRAMLGTVLSNIQRQKEDEEFEDVKEVKAQQSGLDLTIGSGDSDIEDIMQVIGNKETKVGDENNVDELDLELQQYTDDASGFNLSEIVDKFDDDVFGIKDDVTRLVKKDKVKEFKEVDSESKKEQKKVGSKTQPTESNEDEKESEEVEFTVNGVKQEVEEVVELNFRAIDKFYSILSRIKKRSPSKVLYDTLKKGNIKEKVIVDFMKCKNIDYYDYLDIEDIVEDKFGN